ncbi:peptidyl-prolyl cis-trans isomerase [Cupriavidus necator]
MNTFTYQTIRGFVLATLALTYYGLAGNAHSATATPVSVKKNADVVATVNNTPIYRAQVDEAVKVTGLADSPTLRQAIIDRLIARELIRQAAQREAFDKKPEVQQLIAQAKTAIETEAYLQAKLKASVIPEQEVRNRYNTLVGAVGKDEFKAKIMTLKNAEEATATHRRVTNGESFDAIVDELRRKDPKSLNGELPWVSFKLPLEEGKTNGYPLALAQTISKLQAGEVASPLLMDGDYYIVKVEQKRPTQIPAFETIKDELQRQMEMQQYQQALQTHVEQLRKQATIQQ